ncbi:autotransporter outer membrane beta-barrel domain-containing protein [Neisseriaceae bacterium TC5R-5]|nr:autotransporter outer membrane beta-barrel domain-containing protein [Neisseriaceae bacterium TC5R-5]
MLKKWYAVTIEGQRASVGWLSHGLCGLLFWSPVGAWAACTNVSPGSGESVLCSGVVNAPVQAQAGSQNVLIQLDASSLVTLDSSLNRVAMSVDSTSELSNFGRIELTGDAAAGVNRGAALLAVNTGNRLLNGVQGEIASSGAFVDGMAADGPGNTLINQGKIITLGANAFGMSAAWLLIGGQPENSLNNSGQILTHGANARGMSILGSNGLIVNSGLVQTTGSGATAVVWQGNSNQLLNSGRIEASGSGANALFSNTVGPTFMARVENLATGELISQQDVAVRMLNGSNTLINAGLVQGGAGVAVVMGGDANTVLLQTGSRIVGMVEGGGNVDTRLILQGSGVVTNAFSGFGSLQMEGSDWQWQGSGSFNTIKLLGGAFQLNSSLAGATLIAKNAQLSGNGVLTGDVVNEGVLSPGAGLASGQLIIVGHYTGSSGILRINSQLGTDASPASLLAVKDGALAGATLIQVKNLGGKGGQTTGDGILLVQASAAQSAPQAFTLAGGSVSAGAYAYFLQRGGLSTGTADNWYLRSSLPDEEVPGGGGSGDGKPPSKPVYRAEVPLYAEIPSLGRELMLEQLGTLQNRQSNLGQQEGRQPFWLRTWAEHTEQQQAGDVTPTFNGQQFGVQLGKTVFESGGSRIGALFGLARASGDVQGFALGQQQRGVGELSIDSAHLGGYWTYLIANGGYSDLVLQLSSLKVSANSTSQVEGNTRGYGVAASWELGRSYALGERWRWQPQAQLIWQQAHYRHFDDSVSDVLVQAANSVTGRLGARLETDWLQSGLAWHPYLQLDVLRTTSTEDEATFAGQTTLKNSPASTVGKVGLGLFGQFKQSSQLQLSVGYSEQWNGTHRQSGFLHLQGRWYW